MGAGAGARQGQRQGQGLDRFQAGPAEGVWWPQELALHHTCLTLLLLASPRSHHPAVVVNGRTVAPNTFTRGGEEGAVRFSAIRVRAAVWVRRQQNWQSVSAVRAADCSGVPGGGLASLRPPAHTAALALPRLLQTGVSKSVQITQAGAVVVNVVQPWVREGGAWGWAPRLDVAITLNTLPADLNTLEGELAFTFPTQTGLVYNSATAARVARTARRAAVVSKLPATAANQRRIAAAKAKAAAAAKRG